jgi:hypothetical protein
MVGFSHYFRPRSGPKSGFAGRRTLCFVALDRSVTYMPGSYTDAPPTMIGWPILRALCEGWDTQNVRGKGLGVEPSYPTLRKEREGWGTRSLVFLGR